MPAAFVAAEPQSSGCLWRCCEPSRQRVGKGEVILVDPGKRIVFIQLPTETGHGFVKPSDDAECLQIDDRPVLTWFGHAVEQTLLEHDGWGCGGHFLGGTD